MGCGESRQSDANMANINNYYTLTTAFVNGEDYELSLFPIDQLEYLYKDSLPENAYGAWDKKNIYLDDELRLNVSDTDVVSYAETAQK